MTARDLVVTQNITLDGVIDAAGDWFGVSVTGDAAAEAEFAEVQREHRDSADAVLLGRVTYESFAGFWPLQTEDRTGVSAYLDCTEKYVVSATFPPPSWQHTTVLRGPVVDEAAALKQRPGSAIVVTGSISLVHALLPTGLIDEYRLFVFPVVLGTGRRLFPDGYRRPALHLVEVRSFRSGIALLRYRTASAESSAESSTA